MCIEKGSPRKDNEPTQASSGAFQVYRRPAAQLSNATVASDCIPKKSLTCSKGLTSVIEDHRRRGIVLRKQQQLLAKQLVEIQVRFFSVISWICYRISTIP